MIRLIIGILVLTLMTTSLASSIKGDDSSAENDGEDKDKRT